MELIIVSIMPPQEGYGVIVLNTNYNSAGPGDTPIRVRKLINFMITMYVCMYVCVCTYAPAHVREERREGEKARL